MPQTDRERRDRGPSTFTNYVDPHTGITATVPPHVVCCTQATTDETCVRQGMVSPLGENFASPKLPLASEKTPPRPSSTSANYPSNNSPRILQEATPTTVLPPPCTTACPEAGSAKALGGTSVSPELGVDLNNIAQRTSPTPPRRLPTTGWL
jgi:hypothetical protein